MNTNATRLGLAEHQSKETYAPQGVLGHRAAKRCLALAGVTVVAMIPLTESTSEAQAQSANTYTCPGARIEYQNHSEAEHVRAAECVLNAAREYAGSTQLTHSPEIEERAFNYSRIAAENNSWYLPIDGGPQGGGGPITTPLDHIAIHLETFGSCKRILSRAATTMGLGIAQVPKSPYNYYTTIVDPISNKQESFDICESSSKEDAFEDSIVDPLYTPPAPSKQILEINDVKIKKLKKNTIRISADIDDEQYGKKKPIPDKIKVRVDARRWVNDKRLKTLTKYVISDSEGRVSTTIPISTAKKWKILGIARINDAKKYNTSVSSNLLTYKMLSKAKASKKK